MGIQKDSFESIFYEKKNPLSSTKTSKDAEPAKGPKVKELQSSSSKGKKSKSKSSGKSVQLEDLEFEVVDFDMPYDQEENQDNDDEPKEKVATKQNWLTKPSQPQEPTDPDWNIGKTLQNRRDLPMDIPVDSVVVLRYEKMSKNENKGKMPTEIELVLEQTQQGTSYEVSGAYLQATSQGVHLSLTFFIYLGSLLRWDRRRLYGVVRLYAVYAFISAFTAQVDWDAGSYGWRQMLRCSEEDYTSSMGNGQRAAVEAIGSYDLCFPSGLVIVLHNYNYDPSITRGVILVSRFSNTNNRSMYDVSNKRAKLNLNSSLLWHCHLGHINKKCIEKLQHDGLLNLIDTSSFEKYVSCLSGKMARKPYSHQVERAKDLLGLIHTDNVELFDNSPITQEASGSLKDLELIQEEDTHPSENTSSHHDKGDQEINEPQRSIMYAVRCTGPDVAFALNMTSRFQQNPGDIKQELRISYYIGVGYLTNAADLKSQTGYVFVLNGGVVD
nr:retrotransposon protein, putative, Ty1-copia subclass [Tanacetum cinerariifolium]